MNLAEALLNAFKDHGIKEIFGLPGDFALPFFKVIEESSILPLYTLSHEPAVGFAADAAARCHCRPSVAAVTYGAGALNMVNAVAAAYSAPTRQRGFRRRREYGRVCESWDRCGACRG